MKKLIVPSVIAAAALVAIGRFGPRLEERMKAKCQEMMASANASTTCSPGKACA